MGKLARIWDVQKHSNADTLDIVRVMGKVDIETKIKILEFIRDNINVGLIQVGEQFNLSRFKIKSILIDFSLSAYNTERKLNKTNWDKFIQNKIDLFKEKTYGT